MAVLLCVKVVGDDACAGDYARAEAAVAFLVVDYAELAGCYALDLVRGTYHVVAVGGQCHCCIRKFRRVSVFEGYVNAFCQVFGSPWASGDVVHLGEWQRIAVLFGGVVSSGDVHDVVVGVFAYDIPWASAESQALALSYGVEPKSAMLAQLASGFDFDDRSGALAEVPAYEVVVIYFAKEAYALRVLAHGVGHVYVGGYAAYFLFG